VRRHPSLKLKTQTLSASRETCLRLPRPGIRLGAPLKLFSLGLVFIFLAILKRLEAAPLLAIKQLQDSQISFSGEETTLAAPEEIGTFKFSTEVDSGVQGIIVMKFDLIARS
jgi:hypothetical protein